MLQRAKSLATFCEIVDASDRFRAHHYLMEGGLAKISMRNKTIWVLTSAVAIACATLFLHRLYWSTSSMEGVTLSNDPDARKQVPIPGVDITTTVDGKVVQTKSDAAGGFRIALPERAWRMGNIELQFRHPGYLTFSIRQPRRDQLWVIRMSAISSSGALHTSSGLTMLKDVRLRYSTHATTTISVGSIAKTFEVGNQGNIPCDHAGSCSPDKKWKASNGELTLDAGEGHEFRSVRTSCIAGPCPFTRVESNQLLNGGRIIKISVSNWSDTVAFLVEAEVIQTLVADSIRNAYPAIFGRELSFTLPPTAQGASIEANTNGTDIVYPLSPQLKLSWAVCHLQTGADKTRLFRCELKPGYQFQ